MRSEWNAGSGQSNSAFPTAFGSRLDTVVPDDHSLEPLVHEICDRFHQVWQSGKQPKVSHYAEEIGDDYSALTRRRLLIELIRVDMDCRENRGDVVSVREYLREFPELIGPDGVPPKELLFGQDDTVSAHELETRDPPKVRLQAESQPCLEDYEIISEIARGGMGVVYKARDTKLKCNVALKTIRSGQLAGREEIERFRLEAEAAAQLQHPGIVRIYRIGQSQGLHYFTMGFVEGQSLAQIVEAGPLPEVEAIRFTAEICEAVDYAHQRGILHRDLKPSNVLVNQSGHALVTDFGLAKRLEEDSDVSQSGQALGTPGYMPPEQALGQRENVNFQSDVYSIGALLYHLLTGRPPFRGASQAEVIREVLNTEPTPPQKINPRISRDLNTICMKCLEKEPPRRYVSAAELRVDLHRLSNGFPIHARPATVIEKGWRWYRRHTLVANLLLIICLAIGIGVALKREVATVTRESLESRRELARQWVENEIATAKARMGTSHGDLRPEFVGIESDRLTEALKAYEAVVSEQRRLLGDGVSDREIQRDVANLLFYDAQTTRLLQDFARSESSFLSAIREYDRLRGIYRDDVRFPLWLGKSYDYLGELYRDHDRVEDADRQYRQSIDTLRDCLAEFPNCDEAELELARANNNYGILTQEMNRLEDARVRFENSEATLRGLLDRDSKNVDYRRDLARSLINLGRLERIQENYDRAEELYLEATATFDELLKDYPTSERYRFLAATSKMNHGFMTAVYLVDLDGGERLLKEALSDYSRLPPNIPEYRLTQAKCLLNLCQVNGLRYNQSGIEDDLDSAEEFCDSAHEILRDLHAAHTGVAEFDSWMGVVLGTLGWVADKRGNHDEFVTHMYEAIKFQRDAVEKRPRHREYKDRLQGHHEFFVSRLLAAMGHGFKTDIGDSRFDPIHDDAKFQEAIERLETSLPDDGPVGVVGE